MPWSRISQVSDSQFSEAVSSSTSVSATLRYLNIDKSGNSHTSVQRRIAALDLPTSHFLTTSTGRQPPAAKSADEFFVLKPFGSGRTAGKFLKRSLLESGVPYKCLFCGIRRWRGQELTLQVDHENGNPLDNRKENLRFLCLNCHSLTETFGNKRRGEKESPSCQQCGVEMRTVTYGQLCVRCGPRPTKITWPGERELRHMVSEHGYRETGRLLGVSDNAVRKHLKKMALKQPDSI